MAVNKTRIGLLGSDRTPNRIGSDCGSDRIGSDRIGLVSSLWVQKNYLRKAVLTMTSVARNWIRNASSHNMSLTASTRIFSSGRAACLTNNKKNRFSCITRLRIHHQLENHRKELFSTELHWEIFCCITSYDYNSKKRIGQRDITRIEDGGERCKYLSLHCFVFLSISTLFWIGLVFHWALIECFFLEETIKEIAGMTKVR